MSDNTPNTPNAPKQSDDIISYGTRFLLFFNKTAHNIIAKTVNTVAKVEEEAQKVENEVQGEIQLIRNMFSAG